MRQACSEVNKAKTGPKKMHVGRTEAFNAEFRCIFGFRTPRFHIEPGKRGRARDSSRCASRPRESISKEMRFGGILSMGLASLSSAVRVDYSAHTVLRVLPHTETDMNNLSLLGTELNVDWWQEVNCVQSSYTFLSASDAAFIHLPAYSSREKRRLSRPSSPGRYGQSFS